MVVGSSGASPIKFLAGGDKEDLCLVAVVGYSLSRIRILFDLSWNN
jgi:hypothetical protein